MRKPRPAAYNPAQALHLISSDRSGAPLSCPTCSGQIVRNPASVRPWQFVLEPLSGYLLLAAKLLREGAQFAEAWNFGPQERLAVSVRDLVEELLLLWGEGDWEEVGSDRAPHETALLRLSWEKAANRLGWRPVYTWREALAETVAWYKEYHAKGARADMYDVCAAQIRRYGERARESGAFWTL